MDIAGDYDGSGDAVVFSPVAVYDENGRLVGVDTLKKNDLLLVYWKKPQEWSITTDIQGTNVHRSLIYLHSVEGNTLWGTCLEWTGHFSFDLIDKIQVAGNDPSGRTSLFVVKLWEQKARAEETNRQMISNIDALKVKA